MKKMHTLKLRSLALSWTIFTWGIPAAFAGHTENVDRRFLLRDVPIGSILKLAAPIRFGYRETTLTAFLYQDLGCTLSPELDNGERQQIAAGYSFVVLDASGSDGGYVLETIQYPEIRFRERYIRETYQCVYDLRSDGVIPYPSDRNGAHTDSYGIYRPKCEGAFYETRGTVVTTPGVTIPGGVSDVDIELILRNSQTGKRLSLRCTEPGIAVAVVRRWFGYGFYILAEAGTLPSSEVHR